MSGRSQGLENARDNPPGLRDRVRLRRSARARPDAGGQGAAGPVPRRPDQRHDRLRGGGRPGPRRRAERRGARRSGRDPVVLDRDRGLHRRDDRRPGDPRRDRALPDVHLARRVPPAPARRQRRPAADAARDRARLRRRRARRAAFERKARGAWTRRAAAGRELCVIAAGGGAARARRSTRTACGAARSSCWAIRRSALEAVVRGVSGAGGGGPRRSCEQLERDARYAPYLDAAGAGRRAAAARRGASRCRGRSTTRRSPGLSQRAAATSSTRSGRRPWRRRRGSRA